MDDMRITHRAHFGAPFFMFCCLTKICTLFFDNFVECDRNEKISLTRFTKERIYDIMDKMRKGGA